MNNATQLFPEKFGLSWIASRWKHSQSWLFFGSSDDLNDKMCSLCCIGQSRYCCLNCRQNDLMRSLLFGQIQNILKVDSRINYHSTDVVEVDQNVFRFFLG